MSRQPIPYPPDFDVNYHADRQERRVARAKAMIDVGDVIAIVESRLAAEANPKAHPIFPVINFLLDRQTAVDGGAFWDAWKQRCLAAIDTAIDDVLETMEG
jgi:hypothetical protein